eukprot:903372-Ditylum_brightwellii.AAC.1
MRGYLKPQNTARLTQVDIPKWDKLKCFLVMGVASIFCHMPIDLQWWLTSTCVTLFLHMVTWRSYFVDWISYRQVVIKEEMDCALFQQHVHHLCQATGTPFMVDPLVSTI